MLRSTYHRAIFFPVIVFMLLSVVLLPSQTVQAATFTVTNTNDSGAGSLRQAILDAQNEDNYGTADTIVFNIPGGPAVITLQSDMPPIIDPAGLTIDGGTLGNITISGANAFQPFRLQPEASLTLENLVITQGFTTDRGGAIFNEGGTVVINNSILSNNTAAHPSEEGDGGAIANSLSGKLEIYNSTITGNTAKVNGGGIFSYTGTVTIQNSTISGNTVENSFGGGFSAEFTNVNITNSTITGNTADSSNGGGLYIEASPFVLLNSTVSGNSALFGGGIYAMFSTSTFRVSIINSTISGNSAQSYGGGLYTEESDVHIVNSTFYGNSAVNGEGGAGGAIANGHADVAVMTISHSTIAGNNADYGGGIYNSSNSTTYLKANIVAGNTAPNGADCFNAEGSLNSEGSNIFGQNDDPSDCPAEEPPIDIILSSTIDTVLNTTPALNGAPVGSPQTLALAAGSPAIDFNADCTIVSDGEAPFPFGGGELLTVDQRGASRPVGDLCDSGALEDNPPAALDDNYVTAYQTQLDVPAPGVLTNDLDSRGGSLLPTKLTDPANGTLNFGSDGGFTYTPAAGFSGTDSFTYKVSNGVLESAPATVLIDVENPSPVAVDDSYEGNRNTPLTVIAPGVLLNDSDPNGDSLTAIDATVPANGTVTLNPNGSFTYTPNAEFWGVDSFTYRANDGTSNSNIATVTINVSFFDPTPTPGPSNLQTDYDPDDGTIRPTFSWTHIIDADGNNVPGEWYNLVIFAGAEEPEDGVEEEVILDTWYLAELICFGTTCLVTPTEEELPIGLLNGGYRWRVRSWHPDDGFGDWSVFGIFSIDVEAPGAVVGISLDVSTGRPIITWPHDTRAAWYQVRVVNAAGNTAHLRWYQKTPQVCSGAVCVLTADATLLNGDYVFDMQAWGLGGFSLNNPDAWSGPIDFELDFDPPGDVEMLTATNTNSGSPTFVWHPVPRATWHLLWIGTHENGVYTGYYMNWQRTTDMVCPGGDAPCELTPMDMFLPTGTYQAWTLSWGPGGYSTGGEGGWSQGVTFSVVADPPGEAVPLAPLGTINRRVPDYTWDHLPGVTWYSLWIGNPVDFTTHYLEWHRASEIECLTGTCRVTIPEMVLGNGGYVWAIRTYNPVGLGPWSDIVGFTVAP